MRLRRDSRLAITGTAAALAILLPGSAAAAAPQPASRSTGQHAAGQPAAGPAATRQRAARQAAAGQAAARRIAPPQRRGRLRITGRLRDGGVVTAAGLSWRPGALPRGDRLLSFEVSYTWKSCPAAGKCRAAADSTVTPFAARQYRAGHADTGRRLLVTETAAEVVETSPATFSFRVIRASKTTVTAAAVRAYPAGRRPSSAFVNGLPERRTASDEENFQVGAPHYNSADGRPAQRYRIGRGRWRALPASRVFSTGKLRPGRHQVSVRTADRAGATVARFSWRVLPLPAPVACRPRPHRPCWYPPHLNKRHHPMRWDWQIGRVAPLQRTGRRAVDIYDVDGFLTTKAQVRAIRTRWQASTLRHPKAVCYLDLAWEDYRPDGSPGGPSFPRSVLGHVYFGFPQERWVDLRQLDALKPMLDRRIAMCARKGFDAVELDDIDSFDPPSTTGFQLTPGDAQNFLAYAFNQVHRDGMTALWKNSPLLSWWGRQYTDGAVVEECYAFHQCFAGSQRGSRHYGITCTGLTGRTPCGWDDFTADRTSHQPTGKWVGEAEYGADHYVCDPGQQCPHRRLFRSFCRAVYSSPHGFAAVKFDVDLNGATFLPCPRGR